MKCGEFLDLLQNQLASQEGLCSMEWVSKQVQTKTKYDVFRAEHTWPFMTSDCYNRTDTSFVISNSYWNNVKTHGKYPNWTNIFYKFKLKQYFCIRIYTWQNKRHYNSSKHTHRYFPAFFHQIIFSIKIRFRYWKKPEEIKVHTYTNKKQ